MPEKKVILFLTANPAGTTKLDLDREAREVGEELQRAKKRDEFELEQKRAVRLQDLRRAMFDHKPYIVHFSGHGMPDGLILENDKTRNFRPVKDGDAVEDEQSSAVNAYSNFFRLFANQVECVLLNACYSKPFAEAIGKHIKYVIGMKKAIGDEAAIQFAVGFYQAIGAGFSIEDAFESGKTAIQMQNIPEHLTPVLHIRTTDKTFYLAESKPSVASGEPIKIFYSYAHEDEKLRKKIETSLAALQRQKLIESWSDRQIPPGAEWSEQIDARLNAAQIILLLVSDDFIASNYCYNVEMERAMERHETREAIVIPIILRECLWQKLPFAKLQALPRDARAITSWTNRNEAFYNVALGIETVIGEINRI